MAISTTFKDLVYLIDLGYCKGSVEFINRFFNLRELLHMKVVYYETFAPKYPENEHKWLLDLIDKRINELK